MKGFFFICLYVNKICKYVSFAKKYERQREEMKQDVDAVITTRELARMIKQAK